MSETVPLVPGKGEALCADVRAVLRETFRELEELAPVAVHTDTDGQLDLEFSNECLIMDIKSDCTEIEKHEKHLQNERARRIARDCPINTYLLHSLHPSAHHAQAQRNFGLLQRNDLKPSVEQNGDNSLWIQNTLNRSSGNLSLAQKAINHATLPPPNIKGLHTDAFLLPSNRKYESEIFPTFPPVPPPLTLAFIVAIPSKVDFVNFTVGQVYTRRIRLVNTSKQEICLSIHPPLRQDFHVELCSRLTVTSGAAAELNLHFTPRDVRTVLEELPVRVSVGQSFVIPIHCYIKAPTLEILVPHTTPTSTTSVNSMKLVSDILDLGAKLVGDVHRSPLVLKCSEPLATFFILPEESWQDCTIDIVKDLKTSKYGVCTDHFYIQPVQWTGDKNMCCVGCKCGCQILMGFEGVISAFLPSAGTRLAEFRIMASNAVVRQLSVLADAVMFSFSHITLMGHEKDFDICDKEDPHSMYYANVGTAFTGQPLTHTLQIVNNSSIEYKYCWETRVWGENFSEGGISYDCEDLRSKTLVSVKECSGVFLPHKSLTLTVQVDGCYEVRAHRVVLMLILKDIPVESIPFDCGCIVVNPTTVLEDGIPGVCQSRTRVVCSLTRLQLEVRWTVAPIHFLITPSTLTLRCSHRVKSVKIPLRLTQVYGVSGIVARIEGSEEVIQLTPEHDVTTSVSIPLEYDKNNQVITLTSVCGSWSSSCVVQYSFTSRHPAILPILTTLPTLTPASRLEGELQIYNNTYQDLNWCVMSFPWFEPLPRCLCAAVTPACGDVLHSNAVPLQYTTNAPRSEGCFCTVMQVTGKDRRQSSVTNAALLAYRVLVPRVVLTVVDCIGCNHVDGVGVRVDVGISVGLSKGAPLLRMRSLYCGECVHYQLRLSNITVVGARVIWEEMSEDDILKVTFLPNECEINGYSDAVVLVQFIALRVTPRRILVRRALVEHSRPLYLLIDTAISGVEVTIEFPIGGDEHTDSLVTMRMIQKEDGSSKSLVEEMSIPTYKMFATEDLKRLNIKDNICHCPAKMLYIPPKKTTKSPRAADEYPPIEFVYSPPLTRVCRCMYCSMPILPQQTQPCCLQFIQVPINKVWTRTIVLRNEASVEFRWRCAVRRWPLKKTVCGAPCRSVCGVSVDVPRGGRVLPLRSVAVPVSVHTDTWGVYQDQLLIQVDKLEPIVIDVWIEVVGSPLQFALRPSTRIETPPVLWMTSQSERTVLFTNTAATDVLVYTYMVKDHDYIQDSLPFRLYFRLYDVPFSTCPSMCHERDSESASEKYSKNSEVQTGVELFLASDFGVQDALSCEVTPSVIYLQAGAKAEFKLRLLSNQELTPNFKLILRTLSTVHIGQYWYRPPPPLQYVSVRGAHS